MIFKDFKRFFLENCVKMTFSRFLVISCDFDVFFMISVDFQKILVILTFFLEIM